MKLENLMEMFGRANWAKMQQENMENQSMDKRPLKPKLYYIHKFS